MNTKKGTDDMESKDMSKLLPKHIGVIMDGNRRWAKKRGLPGVCGHKKGIEVLKCIINKCKTLDIKYLTVYTLSTDNQNRDKKEVEQLIKLIDHNLMEIDNFKSKNIRVRIVGNRDNISTSLFNTIERVETDTCDCNGLIVSFALNYGGQDEIVSAFNSILLEENVDEITIELLEKHMYSGFLPKPELIIRSGGEQRLSGFLLWKAANSDLIFHEKLWPDFTVTDFMEAII